MSKESNIDKLFRENLSDHNPSFNPDNWAKMEAILESTASSQPWYRSYSRLMAISLIGLFALVHSTVRFSPNTPTTLAVTNQQLDHSPEKSNHENDQTTVKAKTIEVASIQKPKNNSARSSFKSNQATQATLAAIASRQKTDPVATISLKSNVTSHFYTSSSENLAIKRSSELNSMNSSVMVNELLESVLALTPHGITSFESDEIDLISNSDPVSSKAIYNQRHTLSLAGFNTINNGFRNNSGLFGKNILNRVEFNYSYQLKNNLAISTGLAYNSKTAKGLNYTQSNEQYGFGRNANTTSINVQSLNYIEVPLAINYQIGSKHTVGIGASFNYLLAVRNRVIATTFETLEGESSNSTTRWGGNEKFSPFDVGIRANYSYAISPRFKLAVSAQFGTINFSNNAAWGGQGQLHHQELQIGLRYQLFRF
jgi:hypothetical protein